VKSGHQANPVSQSLTVASGVLLQRTLSFVATRGTAMKEQQSQNRKKRKRKAAVLEAQKWKHQEYWTAVYS